MRVRRRISLTTRSSWVSKGASSEEQRAATRVVLRNVGCIVGSVASRQRSFFAAVGMMCVSAFVSLKLRLSTLAQRCGSVQGASARASSSVAGGGGSCAGGSGARFARSRSAVKRAKVAAAAAAARWSFIAQPCYSSCVFQQSHEHSCSPGLYDAWAAAGCICGAALCLTANACLCTSARTTNGARLA